MRVTTWGTTRKTDLDMDWELSVRKTCTSESGNSDDHRIFKFPYARKWAWTKNNDILNFACIGSFHNITLAFSRLVWSYWWVTVSEPYLCLIFQQKTILVWLCNRRTKHKSIHIECKPAHFRQPSLETWSRCSRPRSKPQPDSQSRLRNTQV